MALAVRPVTAPPESPVRAARAGAPILRAAHRTSGILIAAFALAHIANHLVALSSIAAHIAFQFFFAPYYFLAVLALFTHLGGAMYWRARSRTARTLTIALPVGAGATIALLIVLSLAGMLQPVDMPAKYMATYAG